MAGQTRILIVEDSELFRSILAVFLQQEADFEVVGQADDGLSGIALAAELLPDIIIMDVRMPGEIDGIEATRRILAARPASRVVGFSSENVYRQLMLDAGAKSFVAKDRATQLIDCIQSLMAS